MPSSARQNPGRRAVARVLAYFASHPEACDDAEGVARWRLAEERVRVLLDDTIRALDALAARGVLERSATPGRAPLYRVAPGRQTAVRPAPGARTREGEGSRARPERRR